MHRLAVFLLAFLALGMGGTTVGHAAVRHYEKLSVAEQIALQVSEARVVEYDQALVILDRQHRQHKISADDYQWKTSTLVYYIQLEAQFQDEILKQRPISLDIQLPDGVDKVLQTVGKYTLIVGYYAARIALTALASVR